ncbi:uncharacterized protein [Channa argus]|uniref:uncharacterized protein isoform X2 n=1 Tax=Channa argus TaxID=215402 RepID=UPI0035213808
MVQDYKPTFQDLERLLKRQLGCDFHKVRHLFTNSNLRLRLKQQDWEHEDNALYRNAVTLLVQGVQAKFPLKQDMSVISAIQQEPNESVGAFLARLTEAYDIHSGHVPPEDGLRRNPMSSYEAHEQGEQMLDQVTPIHEQTADQEVLFKGDTPHIPLAKPSDWSWQELGPWLQSRLLLEDFQPTASGPRKEYSRKVLCPQVKAALSTPADTNLHNLKPGDWVLIKDHRRKHWRQRRFTGPHQVLLTSSTAVKVEGHATWVHASHCKKIPTPGAEKELHPEEHQLDMETTAVEDDQQARHPVSGHTKKCVN